jgi:hypothetical protein
VLLLVPLLRGSKNVVVAHYLKRNPRAIKCNSLHITPSTDSNLLLHTPYLDHATFLHYVIPLFLKLGSAKGCQVFRETKVRSGRGVVLGVLNLYVRMKIGVETFGENHSVTESTQSIAASIQKLPYSIVKSASRAHR